MGEVMYMRLKWSEVKFVEKIWSYRKGNEKVGKKIYVYRVEVVRNKVVKTMYVEREKEAGNGNRDTRRESENKKKKE